MKDDSNKPQQPNPREKADKVYAKVVRDRMMGHKPRRRRKQTKH